MLKAVLIIIGYIIIVWFVLSMCKAAKNGDRGTEELERQLQLKKKSEENLKWCDDECVWCSENDWCWFSEMKDNKKLEENDF